MSTKITKNTKQSASQLCLNKPATDQYIHQYQSATAGAVENILNMGLAVKEVYYKSKNGELNDHDLQYFCESVGLKPKSSQFRKYKCIGEKAHIFKQYLDQMPQSFSVLYEIATLDADTFDLMYVTGTTPANITLAGIKELAKKSAVPARNKISNQHPRHMNFGTLQKIAKETNRFEIYVYSSLPTGKQDEVVKTLFQFQESGLIRFDMPQIMETIEEDSDDLELAA